MARFLILLHAIFCAITGYTFWYLIIWLFSNQNNPLYWSTFTKIIFFLFGMAASESLRNAKVKITIKTKKDE